MDLVQPLADQIEPYREYGDAELAVSLLSFQKQFGIGVPMLSSGDIGTFGVNVQPANAGAEFVCPHCDESVRGVSIPGVGVCRCPLCGETPGALALGRGIER